MEWHEVQEVAFEQGCWVRYLGVDHDEVHHAIAGPRSILFDIYATLNEHHPTVGFDPNDIEACEEVPLAILSDLQLPASAGDTPAQAGAAALESLMEHIAQSKNQEA